MSLAFICIMMSTTVFAARKFILSEYNKDTLKDIAYYGCVSGCAPDFIYTHDILQFFKDHQQEIEGELEVMLGDDYIQQLAGDAGTDIDTLITRMVWTFVESIAQSEVDY